MIEKIMAPLNVGVRCHKCDNFMWLSENGSISCVRRDCSENGKHYESPKVELIPFVEMEEKRVTVNDQENF